MLTSHLKLEDLAIAAGFKDACTGPRGLRPGGNKPTRRHWADLGLPKVEPRPCYFLHESRDLKLVVHSDEITVLGRDEDLDFFEAGMKSELDVKAGAG